MSASRHRQLTNLQSTYNTQYEQKKQVSTKKWHGLIRRLTVFGVLITIVSFSMISTLVSQEASIEKKLTEQKKLEEQLAELNNKQVLLEEEIVRLNDDEYIAKLARREYFLSKDNEIIFSIQNDSSPY